MVALAKMFALHVAAREQIAKTDRAAAEKLDTELFAAREHARRMTAMNGNGAREAAVAWDVVEELLAAKARRRSQTLSPFERYCQENPSAREARMYDI